MNDILNSIKFVKENSKYVYINETKIDEIVKNIDFSVSSHWLNSNPFDILSLDITTIVQLLLIYHSVGFCYWKEPKWTVNIDDVIYDGGFAMLGILVKYFKEKVNTNNISVDEFLELIASENKIPLLNERINNIRELNKINRNIYDDIKELKTDKELFNYIIDNYKYFDDISIYKDKKVYLFKLAQLLTSDILHVREIKENLNVNYNNLIGCADYKIAGVLRCYDILEYNKELSNLIDNKVEILKDSQFEIEIRANTLYVIDLIYNKINKNISRIDINDIIWLMGQDKSKMTKPYHRTYSKYY